MATRHHFFTLTLALLICCFCSSNYSAKAQTRLNLDSCLQWAIDNYPLVEQLQLIDLSRDYSIKNINTGYIPKLNIMGFGGYIEGFPNISPGAEEEPWRFAGVVHLDQTIWDGGRLQNQKKIVKAEAEVDKKSVEVRLLEIKSKVSEIYFSILLAKEQQTQLNLQLESMQSTLKTLQASAREGVSFLSDAEEVEVKILQTKQKMVQLKTSEKSYHRMLSIFTHTNIPQDAVFERPGLVAREDANFENRPEIALFESRKNLLDAYNPGPGEVLPKVSLQGFGMLMAPKIQLNTNKWNHFLAGGLTVSWPISGRAYTFAIDKKRLGVEKSKVDREKESFELNQQMNISHTENLIAQWDTLITFDDQIITILSRRTKTAESRYKNGVIPIGEWLKSVSEESAARQEKAMHEIQKEMAIYQHNTELGY